MNSDDLTPEQKEKARARTSSEEMLELAREEGFELTDERLLPRLDGVVGRHAPFTDMRK